MVQNTNVNRQSEQSSKESHPTLEELVRGYLDAQGKDKVVQVDVDPDGFEGGLLSITCHAGSHDELPDIVTETNVITYHDYQYDVHLVEDQWGPSDLGRITLYAADTITGMDAVSLDEGLAEADEYMQDLLDCEEFSRNQTLE